MSDNVHSLIRTFDQINELMLLLPILSLKAMQSCSNSDNFKTVFDN